jgi:hypothetical protein
VDINNRTKHRDYTSGWKEVDFLWFPGDAGENGVGDSFNDGSADGIKRRFYRYLMEIA